jgi:hypothetical protein
LWIRQVSLVYEYPHNFLGSRTEYKYNHLEKHLWRGWWQGCEGEEKVMSLPLQSLKSSSTACARSFMRRVEKLFVSRQMR